MKSYLVLGISTAKNNIAQILPLLESATGFDKIIICHQSFEDTPTSQSDLIKAAPFLESYLERLILIRQAGKGLARSRNAILKACPEGSWLVPTDDDVLFHPEAPEALASAIKIHKGSGVLALQAYRDPDAQILYKKNYKNHGFRHNQISIRSISSIEICVNCDALRHKGVTWDERFGLGARFGGGLENVFLQNVHDSDLSIRYWPALLCQHPAESSGSIFNESKGYIRGAVAVRTLGVFLALSLALYTTFRHRRRIQQHTNTLNYLKSFIRGGRDYLRTQSSHTI